MQGQFTSGASTISQYAALEALEGEMYPTFAMRDQFRGRRDGMFKELKEIPGIKCELPVGAFYFYPDVSHYFGKTTLRGDEIKNVDEFVNYLIEDAKVAVIPGSAFGTKDHVRISYAYSRPVLHQAMERIKESLKKLT